ncbi:ImmA/IrrE family metallo-endopeptidase [Nocardia harenae]|uniref:ImmA/IrrE family metallo-endopeptidase n=1 Tax=Nocardia harenae TaxID=358707 RepID=UPI000A02E7AC|nr:ImmA/IrrE family metallo-endopeptidase [Nocardia harenae]
MSSLYWRYLAGNTAEFAVEFSLIEDDIDDWMVDPETRNSWGSFAMWVDGVNVCDHVSQGENIRATHWYLLPIAEWFIANWDPILHEERMPSSSIDAASSARRSNIASYSEPDERWLESAEKAYQWEERHSLRFAAPGAILPDLFIRRYGDSIEFSTGLEPPAGDSSGVKFSCGSISSRISAANIAEILFDGIDSLLRKLLTTDAAQSDTYRELLASLHSVRSAARKPHRVAWLSGAGERIEQFSELWQEVHDALQHEGSEAFFGTTLDHPISDESLVATAPLAALLFGSLSPEITAEDVVGLYRSAIETHVRKPVADKLAELGRTLTEEPIIGLTPGEAGSILGEQAWRILSSRGASSHPVPIEDIVTQAGISLGRLDLSDHNIRAVSIVCSDKSAQIMLNGAYRPGRTVAIERFTLAHELAHLLLDQERAAQFAVASGPWAPQDIEQRANAFAASFLMPVEILDAVLPAPADQLESRELREVARILGVSFTALARRLQNLGRITLEDTERLVETLG